MGKNKKKKNAGHSLADAVRGVKKITQKKLNPFEVKFNKQKHNVLGKKMLKKDVGLPGVSKSKANKKRQETLLQEYKKRGKANLFVDRRLGETDPNLTIEDKMLQRYAAEKQKSHDRSTSRYSLNSGEELTHYGQSLSQLEKFEAPRHSDSEDEDEGRITGKMVAEEHFGGFLTQKEFMDRDSEKTWKERMEETIAKSKKAKYDRQVEKDKTIEVTDKLDSDWQELRMLIGGIKKQSKEVEKPKSDDYDVMVRELQFEITGKASDRMKTEEEIAKEEKERLDKLEADRRLRMKGISIETGAVQHRSADDLDDGMDYEGGDNTPGYVVYKDGKLVNSDDEDDDDDAAAEEEDDKDGDEGESDNEDAEAGEEDASDGDEEDEDSYDDIDSDDPDSGDDVNPKETLAKQSKILKPLDPKKKQEVIEKASKELPYVFKAPDSFEEFMRLIEGATSKDQVTIIERIRKCHHVSLAEGNKEKLKTFSSILLQYLGELAMQPKLDLDLIDSITRHIYSLNKQFPQFLGETMSAVLIECVEAFTSHAERHGGRGVFPTLDTVFYLRLIAVLYPTSDFQHHITTPAMLFMGTILAKSPVKNLTDVASGLYLCTVFLQYVSLSKRYIPELINFLRGILALGVSTKKRKADDVLPPFRPVGPGTDLLNVTKDDTRKTEVGPLKFQTIFCGEDMSEISKRPEQSIEIRLSAINTSLHLLEDCVEKYNDLESFREIFTPIYSLLKRLPVKFYPASMKEKCSKLVQTLDTRFTKPRQYLTMVKKKPQPLKTFEPKFDERFDARKKRAGTREENESQRLIHKHKKELKGAVREIRKDAQFLSRVQLKEKLDRDQERNEKVKAIHQMLASQEGDFKALKRKKNSL
ncbi:unnamed protein product [Owenia fusiformis]|uniref:Nucleolar protein 14 n=1 Tax=Owenia fusiformis TaxID=6347 RepID=A0A8S4NPU1_OWEFU|nr:unnamed protein product [Owenia fusiformis]